ncbi:MAG: diaminopimelate epimerase [Marinilabiliaceae bacterium]|nr:diaminopimelate epimerase [Marinilabiliaceae bacterium]
MKINFHKYQGTGNDFIMIDNRSGDYDAIDNQTVEFLCNRKFGVGADGLILLENSNNEAAFKMRYFNRDGKEATFCGNGGRCIVAFAAKLNIIKYDTFIEFQSIVGFHKAIINNSNVVSLKMKDVNEIIQMNDGFFIDTGSPHFVTLCDNIENINVLKEGKKLRNDLRFKKFGGTNVNFMKINKDNSLSIRTFERGVEDETLSCGTGSVASAIVAYKLKKNCSKFIINTLGGKISVRFNENLNGTINDIWLEGKAEFVFEGVFF